MYGNLFSLVLALFLMACGRESQLEKEIAEIHVEVEVDRFDKRFGKATADSLPLLMKEYPYLFPQQYAPGFWVERVNDSLHQELHAEVNNTFPELDSFEEELHSLYQHIRYFFPESKLPKVITLVSEVDYRNKAIWADSLLLISLDIYLGEDHYFYEGMQQYIREDFREELMISDVAEAFALRMVPFPKSRMFLEEMIYYGKILYLKDLLLPFKSDSEKIGYTEEELEWARSNEEQIWRYFVERELLFDTDGELGNRFLYPAPFSKFYLELDSEAPAQLGQYTGWQIVKQYMDRNEVDLRKMLTMDGQEIFNELNYKPRK